jgi:hypothetical protein
MNYEKLIALSTKSALSVSSGAKSLHSNPFASSIRSAVALVLFGAAAMSSALLANFDDRIEGESYDMFSNGGIRFHDVITHEGGATYFVIEDASDGLLGPDLSPPNVLGFGAYVPGPNMAFGCIGAFWFTSDTLATTAGLDVWTFPGEPGVNTLTLRGYRGTDIIQSVSFSFDFQSVPTHRRLDLPIDTYDSFELYSTGQVFQGDSCIDVDNVTIAVVPEPASLTILSVGVGAMLLHRRR